MKLGQEYVQFSKIMVLIVLIAVTVLAAIGICGMVGTGEYGQMAALFAHYTDFAAVVFVAYSGNSVAEKWLISGIPETMSKQTEKPHGPKGPNAVG